jgi:hypothetical protein
MPLVLLNFFTRHPQRQTPRDGVNNVGVHPQLTATCGMALPMVTNLRAVRGKRVLFVADSDNWDYSLRRHGLRLLYRRLLSRLNAEAERVFPVAVLTSAPGDSRRARRLEDCGWRVVSIPWETITTCQGVRKLANADTDLAFECGRLSIITGCDVALIGTGDGDLAVSIARGLRRTHRRVPIAIHTLSVRGASSTRLRQRTDLFDSSVIIGKDMLENINRRELPSRRLLERNVP